MEIVLYADGACSGNPGFGGWAFILEAGQERKENSGSEYPATNNRMELRAAIEGLRALTGRRKVTVITDSQYVQKGITEWMERWKSNGWLTASKKPVENQDLWTELDDVQRRHEVTWRWERGHAGSALHDQCDQLAVAAAQLSRRTTERAATTAGPVPF